MMYDVICLTPVRNGESFIEDFLKKNSQLVDGFIFLDDGSSDNTRDLLNHPKTLSIIHKKFIDDFNDARNRNLLVKESLKFKSKWVIWVDVDEILIGSLDIDKIPSNYDVLSFRRVHLWNSDYMYNSEYPNSDDGIQHRNRMFRWNLGKQLIFDERKKLHFNLTPITHKGIFSMNTIILHRAFITKSNRILKYNNYMKVDGNFQYQPIGYSHILNHTPKLTHIDEITCK